MGRFARELRHAVTPSPARNLLLGAATRPTLEGPRWRRTSRGFHVPSTDVPPTSTQRLVSAASTLPDGAVIGGWAAAFAQGADLLDGLDDHTLQPQPVPVHLPPGLHRQGTTDVVHRQSADGVEPVLVAGIPVTPPLRTAVDLARWAPALTEAVVVLDLVLGARLVSPAALRTAVADARGARGLVQTRRAAALARPGVRSWWEFRLRMAYVLDLGFPTPLVNPAVLRPDRTFVAIARPPRRGGGRGPGVRRRLVDGGGPEQRSSRRRPAPRRQPPRGAARADRPVRHPRRPGRPGGHRTRLLERLAATREHGLARDRRRDRWRVNRSGEK